MKKNIKNLLLKKHSGDTEYVSLAVSIVVLVIFVVMLIFTYMYSILCMNTSDNMDLVLTTYCKRMETQGCLTTSEVNDMKKELEEYGMINITVSGPGTDGIQVPYGEKIYIQVKGDIDYVADSKMGSIKDTITFLRTFLNDPDIGTFRNRTMIKSGTSKN